ncbi:hypothetical protein B0H14DRAFT_3136792 [Mycena olivaceomarginata]|nr:hypothetical protein B0H14DRAFT_3136792 [Mycena olivaceomarginata]
MPVPVQARMLRARIDELSSAIDLQKALLKKLEDDRSFSQRQLNALMDPMARLPLEISSEIFLQTLDPFLRARPGAYYIPMLLLNICNTWTAIALATPALWSAIRIVSPCPGKGLMQLLPLWFTRAGTRPVSLSLTGDLDVLDDGVSATIWQHGCQLKHLEISDYFDHSTAINLFQDTPGPLPLLETLEFDFPGESEDRGLIAPQILVLLSHAPNIVNCIFRDVQCLYSVAAMSEKVVVVPSLRRLLFQKHKDIPPYYDMGLLDCLSLPALQTLSVGIVASGGELRLLSFFKRSSPPLQELTLSLDSTDFIELLQCLPFVPTLSRFKIWALEAQPVANLLAALVDSPSLLPNLRSLAIVTLTSDQPATSPFISASTWDMLLRLLSARPIELHITSVPEPPVDVLAALRELAAGGLHIHIGDDEHNVLDFRSEETL